MSNYPISFPAIDGVSGFTCGVYSYGWTSGCTDEYGNNRGFTQDWYYDGTLGAWVSDTRLNREFKNVNIVGSSINTLGSPYLGTASFEIYDVHYLQFVAGFYGATLNICNPPNSNLYAEMTLIVDNPNIPEYFDIVGKNISGDVTNVHLDTSDSIVFGSGLTSGVHMWKIWTIDGGENYYMYRVNGHNRYWD